ncbi:NACHT domain-containing NTPase [Microbacterium sp. PAMC21962]|nr:NACHT domain-containing protein [Microbacterium sp. PAMC21962]QYF96790.1 NACHT domain-containing protein [Microbacterium sp. PAMC21962]
MELVGESGHEFEQRGLALARALHDPMGAQGAVMYLGKERDGLFVGHDEIHAYEFSIARTKDKASKDGEKLAELLAGVGGQPGNSLKARTGWFITLEEPTAEQRTTIEAISKAKGERLHAISIGTLHQRMVNSERYIQQRDNAPFGSVNFGIQSRAVNTPNVQVELESSTGDAVSIRAMADRLIAGQRSLLVGNYGVGKSHTLREIYSLLRKDHFKKGKLTPFPVHINLRDCAGLKTPAEILRRHSEEIGFDHPNGLISAWRAGTCILLLDGFDEIVPSRWFGGAADLKTVRWEALSPIRRLVSETPPGAGVVVAGRSHYFSGRAEMALALGFKSFEQFKVPDFDDAQLADFLAQAGVSWVVPDWVPMRPLLLGYLVSIDVKDAAGVASAVSRAAGWRRFIDAICEREAQMFTAVRPETIRSIVSRVATLARSRSDVTGPVDMDMLRSAFVAVNGLQPDEEGLQLLLRLPGLATADADDASDSRVFVDRDLADTAYGLDLVDYAIDPYGDSHPLASVASWATASSDLGIEVAADALEEFGVATSTVMAALVARDKQERFDAVMADLIRVATELAWDDRPVNSSFHVAGVYFEQLVLSDHPIYGASTIRDSVIERLDVGGLDETSAVPYFQQDLVGLLDGASILPKWLEPRFSDCEIDRFSIATQTTAGIMQLGIDRDSRIALSILKKVFGQRGSARKEGALSRGLGLAERPFVPKVIEELVSQGWLQKSSSGNNVLYVGVKERRKDALHALESPADFRL